MGKGAFSTLYHIISSFSMISDKRFAFNCRIWYNKHVIGALLGYVRINEAERRYIMATRDCIDYFWVEDFRGIKNKGFHLTRKYNYKFDKEKWLLEREENPDYLDDFYGDDPEVCAIVGNNGVGKTSILNALFYSFSQKIPDFAKKVVIAFRSGNVYLVYPGILGEDFHTFFYHNKMENNKAVLYTNKEETAPFDKMTCFLHSGVVDFNSLDSRLFDDEYDYRKAHRAINISTGSLIGSYVQNMLENEIIIDPVKRFFYSDFLDQINLISSEAAENIKWLTRPARVKIRVKTKEELCHGLDSAESNKFYNDRIGLEEKCKEKCRYVMDIFKLKLVQCIIAYIIERSLLSTTNSLPKKSYSSRLQLALKMANFYLDKSDKTNGNISFNKLLKVSNHVCELISDDEYDSDKMADKWTELFLAENPHESKNKRLIRRITDCWIDDLVEINQFISHINEKGESKKAINDINTDTFHIYFDGKKHEDDEELNLDIKTLFKEEAILFHINSFFDFSWDLSSGEFEQLSLFARLYSYWKFENLMEISNMMANDYKMRSSGKTGKIKNRNDFMLILLDEADMLLHPEWQREYVANVVSFCKKLYKDKTVQIVIATHSPIMLSDIPRQNTLFLKKDKESGEVYSIDGSNTFASNIYGLFKESFFIEGGMIGKYAENKLEELADDILSYSGDESKRESIEKRISMIGDTFIRKNYRELFEKEWPSSRVDKLENIDQLKKRIAELEAQIAKDNNSESESKK